MILVADDNDVLRQMLARQLTILGYAWHSASTGTEAVAAAAKNNYQMLLMDIKMPDITGFETTRLVRLAEAKKGNERTPIIAISAEYDRRACLEAGMDDFIAKPLLLSDLRAVLSRWLPTRDSAEDQLVRSLLNILKQQTRKLGWSQPQLERRYGLSCEDLAIIESGVSDISMVTLVKVSIALDVPVSKLLQSAEEDRLKPIYQDKP